jgi:predicted dehydrogenase
MIRLAVIGAKEMRWREIALRLRGVTLEVGSTLTCDAAYFDSHDVEIERYLQAGKHVLLSPDAGFSRDRLQTYTGLAKEANARFTVANPERHRPSVQLIRQQLDAGKLGEPGLIRVHRWEPEDRKGKLLRDLDLVLWYMGKPPNVVYAVQHLVHLGFPGGAMALLECTDRVPAGDGYYSLSLIGANGAAYSDDHQNIQLVYRGGSPKAIGAAESLVQWSSLLQAFADSVMAYDSNRVEAFPTWLDVLTVSEAVQESLRSKQAVALKGAA